MIEVNPLVSIITVVYNGVKSLEQAILSVINQTYQNIEFIIIDGGSTDGTLDIIKKYEDKIAYWVSEPDMGIYDAMNKGIKASKADLYLILNCDDVLLPDGVVKLVQSNDNKRITAGLVQFVYSADKIKYIYGHSASILIPKYLHHELGYYDTRFKISADTKFIEMAKRGGFYQTINDEIGIFYRGGASSNYRNNVIEHALAMYEAKRWSKFRSFLWKAPRLIYAIFR